MPFCYLRLLEFCTLGSRTLDLVRISFGPWLDTLVTHPLQIVRSKKEQLGLIVLSLVLFPARDHDSSRPEGVPTHLV